MSRRVLVVLRHGETEWNRSGRLNSRTDTGLSPEGLRQAHTAAAELARLPIDRVVVSPSRRARETAEPLRRLVPEGTIWEEDPRLVEMDFGPFEGQRPEELRAGPLAKEFAAWRRHDHPVVPETAEDYVAAAGRAQAVFDSLRPEHEVTVLVTHGYLARLLLVQCILGMPPAHLRRLRLDNGRFAIAAWEGQTPRLVALNTSTLDEVLR